MENEQVASNRGSINGNDVIPEEYRGISLNFMTFLPEKLRDKIQKERRTSGVTGKNAFIDIVNVLSQETIELKLRDFDEKELEDSKEKEEDNEKE